MTTEAINPSSKYNASEICNPNIKPDPTIKPPKYDTISEGYNPNGKSIPGQSRKDNSTMKHITEVFENNWIKFINSFKKHLSLMILFILLGGACGLYLAKVIYDIRMSEISIIGGYVYDGKVYDVKLRSIVNGITNDSKTKP